MAVRKLKGTWWVDFRFDGIRYRKRSPDNSRAGARVYETTLRSKLVKGETLEPNRNQANGKAQPFDDIAWNWFEIYVRNNNKSSEVNGKKSILKAHLVPFFGKTPLDSISNLQVEQYKAKKLSEGLSNKTVNNHLTVLSTFFRTVMDWLELEKTPKIKRLKVPPQKFDFLTQEESETLLSHAQGIWRDMILVALRTGLRLGELRALGWGDINWDTNILTVNRSLSRYGIGSPKSNKARHIPLAADIRQVLVLRRRDTGHIFADEDGHLFEENKLRRTMRSITKRAGLRDTQWHILRHTFASHLAMAGASIKAIQELMGHSDITTTMRYAHLTPSILKETISLLEPRRDTETFGQRAVNRHSNSPRFGGSDVLHHAAFLAKTKQKEEQRLLFRSGGDGGS